MLGFMLFIALVDNLFTCCSCDDAIVFGAAGVNDNMLPDSTLPRRPSLLLSATLSVCDVTQVQLHLLAADEPSLVKQ